jgi:regulator of sirC expression with transglutaminase-like and TPR domain
MEVDSKQLPFLLRLLEDDSPMVRREVEQSLLAFGPGLGVAVEPYQGLLDDYSQEVLAEILSLVEEVSYGGAWLDWMELGDTKKALEEALISLASLESEEKAGQISILLDRLAAKFLAWTPDCEISHLMTFLFQEEGFTSPKENQHNYLNDNLLHVLESRKGNQIPLSCIAILVGWRVGLDLEGISIQGNFMPIQFEEKDLQMYNVFNKGKPLARASVIYIEEAYRRNQTSPKQMKAEVYEIVVQLIRNTIDHLHQSNAIEQAHEYVERFRALSERLRNQDQIA